MQLYSREDIDLVMRSAFFDGEWYLNRYKDLLLLEMSPAEHYLWLGYRLNRDPSVRFNTNAYLEANPDVKKAGINPLLHFIQSGQREGRSPTPESGAVYFLQGGRNPKDGFLNVLLCIHDVHAHLFGGERSFLDVLDQIEELETNIFITIPKNANPDYTNALRRKSAGIFRFHYPQWQHDKPARQEILTRMESIIADHNIDIVYTNTIFLRDIQVVAKKLNRKSFCHVRELIDDDAHLRERIGLETQEIVADLWWRSDCLIANSHATERAFSGARQPVYAPNIIDGTQFDLPNLIGETVNFAIISSNAPKKGIADFVAIARLCIDLAPRARFLIIGPRNAFIEELEHKGVPANLVFRGYASTPQEALDDVNVVMSLSHFAESFGRTIAEAQAARRPVIAYALGAVPELIQDGVTGFLIPNLDITAAAQSVKKICDEPSLINEMGDAGRKKMLLEYAPDVLRDALRGAFSEAMGRGVALRSVGNNRKVTVVIPVCNGYDAVKRCLESVNAWTTAQFADVLVVNDGSLDPEISPMLSSFDKEGGFRIIHNESNLGYTRTVNKAINLCAPNDIVLLNSDTIVTPRWVEGLRDTIYASDDIGTATAMGDHAGAFSFPNANEANPMPEDASHALWATTLIRAAEKCEPVEVPTGNGFCIYIRREVVDQIGLFDEKLFPRGYGEENDFCMRAKAAGWKNLISPRTYIFHERSVSFGAEKTKLLEHATEVMTKRHPSYFCEVKQAFSSDSINQLREALAGVGTRPRSEGVHMVPKSSPTAKFVRLNEELINWDYLAETAPRRDKGTTSIIVCVYNNPELTDRCVRSIVNYTTDQKIEIILVDNGSDAKTAEVLETLCDEFCDVRTISNYENLNFSLGNNIGFAASIGEKVVFLSNDCQVTENWLDPLLASLEDETVKGVQPRLLFPDGTIQCVGVVFSGRDPFGYPIYRGKPNSAKYVGKKRRLQAVTAACLAMRAVDFARGRGFDPRFMNGQEDTDLCLRLNAGTPSFLYVPNSIVYHFKGKSLESDKHIVHNRTELFIRWNKKVVGDDVAYYRQDGMTVPEYEFDIPQFVEQGIACWRPKV
jgi:GT2 family glycosyltransferase/glycosyltransferase involved in cell wall biosynthesis